MSMNICGAPCCWGVDDVKNPYLPPWQRVLKEAGEAGYRAIDAGFPETGNTKRYVT